MSEVELREALRPFAAVADEYDDSEDDAFEVWRDAGPERVIRASFQLGHYRRARAALSAQAQPDERAAIVAWLRKFAQDRLDDGRYGTALLRRAADAIERGDHLRSNPDE